MNLIKLKAAETAVKAAQEARAAAVKACEDAAAPGIGLNERGKTVNDAIEILRYASPLDPPQVRAERQEQRKALQEERAELEGRRQKMEAEMRAASHVLLEANANMVEAGRYYLDAKRDFDDQTESEFHRDLSELPLPELFRKWYAIARGINHAHILSGLDSLRIVPLRMNLQPAAFIDEWRASWKLDPKFAALHADLSEFAKMERRMKQLVDAADEQKRLQLKREQEVERERRLAARSKNQIIYSSFP